MERLRKRCSDPAGSSAERLREQSSDPAPTVPVEDSVPVQDNKRSRVCSGIKGMCTDSPGEVTKSTSFMNENTLKTETIHNIVWLKF